MENKVWHIVNSIGIPTLIAFCWLYVAVPQIEKIRDQGNFISVVDAKQLIREAVLEEREKQADERTASLSNTVASALGVPRDQIAPRITELIRFGEDEMKKHLERENFWNEFKETRFISIINKDGQLFFRWKDGDYQLKHKATSNGGIVYFWRDKNDDKHYLQSISTLIDG